MHHYKKVVDNKHYGGVYEHYTKLMRINTAYTAKGGAGGGRGGGGYFPPLPQTDNFDMGKFMFAL